jgi:uncharacterized protein
VYAFAAQAAGSGGPAAGFLTMAAFSLGTFPAMLVMGGIGAWLRLEDRDRHAQGATPSAVIGAGGFIVLLGLITIARGVLPMSAHLHGP